MTGKIVPYNLLNEDFPELSDTYRIVSLNNDLYWFIRNSEYVLLGYESGRFHLRLRIPFSLFDNPTIEDRGNIYVASDGTSYFCLNGGIARYDRHRSYVDTTQVSLGLSQVRAYNRHENKFNPLPCKGEDAPSFGASSLSYSYNTIFLSSHIPIIVAVIFIYIINWMGLKVNGLRERMIFGELILICRMEISCYMR